MDCPFFVFQFERLKLLTYYFLKSFILDKLKKVGLNQFELFISKL